MAVKETTDRVARTLAAHLKRLGYVQRTANVDRPAHGPFSKRVRPVSREFTR